MIPGDPNELQVLAGQYVLGTLDAAAAAEIERALATNDELRAAVAYWESRLHPLSTLAPHADPDPAVWSAIAARIARDGESRRRGAWHSAALWRGATAAAVAFAACLALYIALAPVAKEPTYLALLRASQGQQAAWVAVIGKNSLSLRATGEITAPSDHAYELWVIAPGNSRPDPLGVIADNGALLLHTVAPPIDDGATLAISVEPRGGSPTGQPTGPVVFTGRVSRSL
jgi:anti-sigma-K factor RskA